MYGDDFIYCKSTSMFPKVIQHMKGLYITWLILGLRPANERQRYFVTPFLIGWAQT